MQNLAFSKILCLQSALDKKKKKQILLWFLLAKQDEILGKNLHKNLG